MARVGMDPEVEVFQLFDNILRMDLLSIQRDNCILDYDL
jgi:hypothetical protein